MEEDKPLTRVCITCREEKLLNSDNFYRSKRDKYGFSDRCKCCGREIASIYRKLNKELEEKVKNKYHVTDEEKIKELVKQEKEQLKKEGVYLATTHNREDLRTNSIEDYVGKVYGCYKILEILPLEKETNKRSRRKCKVECIHCHTIFEGMLLSNVKNNKSKKCKHCAYI